MIDESILVEKIAEAIWNSGYDNNPDAWKYFVMHADKEDSNTIKEVRKEAQAALSIIQPELARKDKIIDAYERGVAMINNAVSDAQSIIDLRKLKTTTGHDNNTQKRGKR